ncbi:MAG: hypothetical protein ACJAR2_004241 [Ilumatobacter sp.]|jgi:hypothetical protein
MTRSQLMSNGSDDSSMQRATLSASAYHLGSVEIYCGAVEALRDIGGPSEEATAASSRRVS